MGSDLVCVGEQPLHAVPLLQFHNKRHGAPSNDFSMPHWINLSFYSSSKRIGYSTFLPRIKMAPILNKESALHRNKTAGMRGVVYVVFCLFLYNLDDSGLLSTKTTSSIKVESALPNSVFDYDAYDAKVFALPVSRASKVFFQNVFSSFNVCTSLLCSIGANFNERNTSSQNYTIVSGSKSF